MDKMTGLYTPRERREILASAAAYDRRTEAEIKARAQGLKIPDHFGELKKALEREIIEAIRFYTADIGFLLGLRERFATDPEIPGTVRRLVGFERHEIEMLKEEKNEID